MLRTIITQVQCKENWWLDVILQGNLKKEHGCVGAKEYLFWSVGDKVSQFIVGTPQNGTACAPQKYQLLTLGWPWGWIPFSSVLLHTQQNLPKPLISQHKETQKNPNHTAALRLVHYTLNRLMHAHTWQARELHSKYKKKNLSLVVRSWQEMMPPAIIHVLAVA